MMQVTSGAPLFLIAGTDGTLVLQAALGGAAVGVVLVILVFAWRLRPAKLLRPGGVHRRLQIARHAASR